MAFAPPHSVADWNGYLVTDILASFESNREALHENDRDAWDREVKNGSVRGQDGFGVGEESTVAECAETVSVPDASGGDTKEVIDMRGKIARNRQKLSDTIAEKEKMQERIASTEQYRRNLESAKPRHLEGNAGLNFLADLSKRLDAAKAAAEKQQKECRNLDDVLERESAEWKARLTSELQVKVRIPSEGLKDVFFWEIAPIDRFLRQNNVAIPGTIDDIIGRPELLENMFKALSGSKSGT
jgi:hypothetical protein